MGRREATHLQAYWRAPRRWDLRAEAAGARARVFCASLADVFDNGVPAAWREDLWALIRRTPSLDWLLLTKRPSNIARMLPAGWGDEGGWPNVWLGTTVEDQAEADRRVPHLLAVPARVRFLSCEPLLGPVDLSAALAAPGGGDGAPPRVHWVIAGGESGPRARPYRAEWARSLRAQCGAAGVAFFHKQAGSARGADWPGVTGKGEDPSEWPEDLRVRRSPTSTATAPRP